MKTPSYTIFIGNPAAGKSTLLNALLGSLVFESGTTFGGGLTQSLNVHVDPEGRFWIDTPGLNDLNRREAAADQIAKALRHGAGDYKLIFVVTCEGGRIAPQDVTTMKLVLDTLPGERKIPYGIIVNKVTEKFRKKLAGDKAGFREFYRSFYIGEKYTSPKILYYSKCEELEDEDDVLHIPTPELVNFVEEVVEPIRIVPDSVRDISNESIEELEAKIKAMQEGMSDDRLKSFLWGLGTAACGYGLYVVAGEAVALGALAIAAGRK